MMNMINPIVNVVSKQHILLRVDFWYWLACRCGVVQYWLAHHARRLLLKNLRPLELSQPTAGARLRGRDVRVNGIDHRILLVHQHGKVPEYFVNLSNVTLQVSNSFLALCDDRVVVLKEVGELFLLLLLLLPSFRQESFLLLVVNVAVRVKSRADRSRSRLSRRVPRLLCPRLPCEHLEVSKQPSHIPREFLALRLLLLRRARGKFLQPLPTLLRESRHAFPARAHLISVRARVCVASNGVDESAVRRDVRVELECESCDGGDFLREHRRRP